MDFTEWDTRVAAYALIIDSRDRLLLTWYNGSRPHPQWTLPGGGVDFSESLEDAVVREVKEETGYDVVIGPALTTSTWTTIEDGPRPPRPYKSVRVVFTASIVAGVLGTLEVGGTTSSAEWIPLDEIDLNVPRAAVIDAALTARRASADGPERRETAERLMRTSDQPADSEERPRVVCLCGSLRFLNVFHSERRRLTSLGTIVLGPEPTTDGELVPAQREALGRLHLTRIDLADEIRIVSEGGYIGSATRREIRYARGRHKVITFVEPGLDF